MYDVYVQNKQSICAFLPYVSVHKRWHLCRNLSNIMLIEVIWLYLEKDS